VPRKFYSYPFHKTKKKNKEQGITNQATCEIHYFSDSEDTIIRNVTGFMFEGDSLVPMVLKLLKPIIDLCGISTAIYQKTSLSWDFNNYYHYGI
jgi:hypothetical protein